MSFFKKAFKEVTRDIPGQFERAGRLLGGLTSPQFRNPRWWQYALGFRDTSPYAPPDPWDIDVSKIRTPEEARATIDNLLGVDGTRRREAEAIIKLRDEGGTSRFVTTLQEYGFTGQIKGMPYSVDGDAMLATGNFATDPVTLMNQALSERFAGDERLAMEYLRITEPLDLLPALVPMERDTERVGQEKHNNFLDQIGRPFMAVKDAAVAQLQGRLWDSVEEAMGDHYYMNAFPDPYLREVMAKKFYDSNLLPWWGNGRENEQLATIEAERIMASGMPSEERAAQFEVFLNNNLKWGTAGFIADMAGKMVMDPLWLLGPALQLGVGMPLRVAGITLPRAGAVARLVTPTGRAIALNEKGIKGLFQLQGMRTLFSMSDRIYQGKRLTEPVKGITRLLFERTAQHEGLAIQTRFREMISGIGNDLVADTSLIGDLSKTFLKGEATERIQAIVPRLLEDPRMARLSGVAQRDSREIWRKVQDQIVGFLDNQEASGIWRPNLSQKEAAELFSKGEKILPPNDVRELILGEMSWVAKQVAEESQMALWNATATGRALKNFMFPASSAIRMGTALVTINNPGFIFLNFVSNSVRLMWHSAFHPLSGAEALARSYWLEAGTIFKGGGGYARTWQRQLGPLGWTPLDVELSIVPPTGAHDLLLGKTLESVSKVIDTALDDSLEGLRKAQIFPAKEVGARYRFIDTLMGPVYVAGRLDKAARRAFFISNLRTQKHLSLAPGGGFYNIFGKVRASLEAEGVSDDIITEIENAFADEIGPRLMEGDEPLTSEIIRTILAGRADRMVAGDASALVSFNAEARNFIQTQRGMVDRQGQAIALKDFDEIVDWANKELPGMLDAAQKAGTPKAFNAFLKTFRQMIRTKTNEYTIEQEITRGLARHPDIIRASTFARSAGVTSEGLRADMADKVLILNRVMAIAFPTAWGPKHPTVAAFKKAFRPKAHEVTTGTAQRLEQIKKLYRVFGGGEADQISRATIISKEQMDFVGLADDLRPDVADVAPVIRRANTGEAFREGAEGRFVYDPDVPLAEALSSNAEEAERLAIEHGRRVGLTNVKQRRDWVTAQARATVLERISSLRAEGLSDAAILERLGAERVELAGHSTRGSLRSVPDAVAAIKASGRGIDDEQILLSARLDVLDDFLHQGRLPLEGAPAPVANIGNLSDKQLLPLLRRLRQATESDRARLLAEYPIEAEQILGLQTGDAAVTAWAQANAKKTLASIAEEPSLGPLLTPPPPGDGATFAQIWDLYRLRSRKALNDLYDFADETVKHLPLETRNRITALRELDERVFVKQQEILQRALEEGTEESWAAAGEQIRNLFQNMTARRAATSGLPVNALPQAVQFNDPAGVLARDMEEFGEYLIKSLGEKSERILSGELKLEDETLRRVHSAIDDVAAEWPDVRDTIIANSRLATDFGMLNYLDQGGIDRIFQMVFPFEFWPTRDSFNWAIRGARAPGAFGALMMMMMSSKDVAEQYGYPQRLQNRFPVLVPGLSDFMEKMPGIGRMMDEGNFAPVFFIDPMRFIFPYTFLRDGVDEDARRGTVAGRILDFMGNVTPLNAGPFQTFVGRQVGLLDKDAWRSNYLSGGPFGIPMTEIGRKTAQFVFNGDREAIPEDEQMLYLEKGHFSLGWLNDILGMSEDDFGVWRAERALVSLLADGELIPGATQEEQITKAMIAADSHQGPEWKKAIKASRAETNLRRLTHWIGFPMGDITMVNEGEMIWFGLKGLYSEYARQGRIAEFYDKYPEFQLRAATVRGLSDPKEREAAIDTELYYESRDRYVNAPFEEVITDIEAERDRLHQMEQNQIVRDQLEVIDAQLGEIKQEKARRLAEVERAFPYRDLGNSLNRSPRERALRQARDAWFEIQREDVEEYDAFLSRREAFLDQFPDVDDNALHELDLWEPEKAAILIRIKANRDRETAFAQNDFDRAREIAADRDAALEQVHAGVQQMITRQDVERYLGSFSDPHTPQQREFEQADAIFDFWMSLVGEGTSFTGREKAAISDYFTSLPEIQRYYPLEALDLENLSYDQRLALMTRRDFWRTYNSIRDANVQLDYLYQMKPAVDAANRLLGMPPVEILDIPPYPAESSGDPLFDHIRMMGALNRRRELEDDESLTPEERQELEQLLATLGDSLDDQALTADDVNRYIQPFSMPDEAP